MVKLALPVMNTRVEPITLGDFIVYNAKIRLKTKHAVEQSNTSLMKPEDIEDFPPLTSKIATHVQEDVDVWENAKEDVEPPRQTSTFLGYCDVCNWAVLAERPRAESGGLHFHFPCYLVRFGNWE
jgi:hypothetical protein